MPMPQDKDTTLAAFPQAVCKFAFGPQVWRVTDRQPVHFGAAEIARGPTSETAWAAAAALIKQKETAT